MLKFSLRGIFWLQRIIFGKSPPFDFVPDGDQRGQKKISPPIKNLEKKPCLHCTSHRLHTWWINTKAYPLSPVQPSKRTDDSIRAQANLAAERKQPVSFDKTYIAYTLPHQKPIHVYTSCAQVVQNHRMLISNIQA